LPFTTANETVDLESDYPGGTLALDSFTRSELAEVCVTFLHRYLRKNMSCTGMMFADQRNTYNARGIRFFIKLSKCYIINLSSELHYSSYRSSYVAW